MTEIQHQQGKLELLLRSVLGPPYYSRQDCVIYNMDCVEAMEKLKDYVNIDLTITSPPYNIGKEYENIIALTDYTAWSYKWINAVYNITKHNGTFWLNLGYISIPNRAKAIPIAYLIWQDNPFFLMQEIVWHYGAGVAAKKFYSPRNEKFLWYVKNISSYTFNLDAVRDPNVKYPNQKKNGRIKVNPLGKNPSDVWIFPKVTSGRDRSSAERTDHPAQFPEVVIERIIIASTNIDDLVMDPFMGSGTTAVVALKLGRQVLGFEINIKYCEIIKQRIEMYFKKSELEERSLFAF